MYGAINA